MIAEPRIINIGAALFADALAAQGATVLHVDWQPPGGGNARLVAALAKLERPEVEAANQTAIERLLAARPALIGMDIAGEIVPGMTPTTVLHAGPPIEWTQMSGPLRGAVIGGLLYEGLAQTEEEAAALAASGEIRFAPCHEHSAVGPMAGVITASMPVFIVENRAAGNRAYATVNEGLGKVLRYGAYAPEVIERLRWIGQQFYPALREAIERSDGIDLQALIAQALHMGDECHNRNRAGTSLFLRAIMPHLLAGSADRETVAQAFAFISGNDHFFLNLSMPAMKCSLDAAHNIPHSTLVTTMARNGTKFGIRVSGTGDRWFTGPAQQIRGLFFPGYSEADANPDIGDSAITETGGIGGFCMGNAPAIVGFVGGTAADALRYTLSMYDLTLAENPAFTLPALNFRGAPTGIDVRRVVESGVLPIINTGIAHREPGVGMVGAGLVHPPRECFEQALLALAEDEEPRT
ncbi:MAG TPA: DUF1116 domain-containing protein [Herpetosiphonaceae bacterium]